MTQLQRADYAGTVLPRRFHSVASQRRHAQTCARSSRPAVRAQAGSARNVSYSRVPEALCANRLLNSGKARGKTKLALLIAAHNEELVLEQTIRSAIKAGMDARHIYVVNDNSSDATGKIALRLIRRSNYMRVHRSGKGVALAKAAKKFKLSERYQWIHIADADGGFSPNYFRVFSRALDNRYAAATGYVRSLPGGTVSQYRVVEYTIGQEIHRRFQAFVHTITVIPGPTSCFRADVFGQVNFANRSITEDFDVTMQIHRQRLGRIQFIPEAIAYTQDPRTTADFTRQIIRWNRGTLQGMRRHQIGLRATRLDAYLSYQVLQNILFFANYFILLPLLALHRHSPNTLAVAFLSDILITLTMTALVVLRTKRWDILGAFPHIYIYRYMALFVFLRAFFEVMLLRKFRISEGVWGTSGRRYKSEPAAALV